MCEFTTDLCEDLALALTTCRILNSLNLDWITLDPAGMVVLCDALNHKDCNLKMLGSFEVSMYRSCHEASTPLYE